MIGLGPRVAMVALTASLLGCGPHVLEPETWMVGTFSGAVAQLGCTASDVVYRYIVHQDGRFDVIKESGYSGIYAEHHAQWEQHEPGRFRVTRDAAYTDVEFYPVEEGTEWEVTRSFECEPSAVAVPFGTASIGSTSRPGSGKGSVA